MEVCLRVVEVPSASAVGEVSADAVVMASWCGVILRDNGNNLLAFHLCNRRHQLAVAMNLKLNHIRAYRRM